MNDDELIERFERGAVAAESFHHADHLRLAFAYLRRYQGLEALGRFSAGLQRFAAAQGKADRYHETITWAYLLLIRERMARAGDVSWKEFAEQNADLFRWKDGVLSTLYRPETLASELARRMFVLPDGCALSS